MSETRNVQVVKDAYAAFMRGDINGVLALVADNVEWHAIKGAEGVAPHAGARHGRAREYAVNVKSTGRSIASEWAMVFTIRDGKIVRFREWTDSAQVVQAYGGRAGV